MFKFTFTKDILFNVEHKPVESLVQDLATIAFLIEDGTQDTLAVEIENSLNEVFKDPLNQSVQFQYSGIHFKVERA